MKITPIEQENLYGYSDFFKYIKLLFDMPSEEIWEHATKSLGININDISNIGGMA